MSKINGDKARSAVQRRQRNAQRVKDRLRRAAAVQAAAGEKKSAKKTSSGA